MRKRFIAGTLAVFALFLPLKSRALPLDVPYQIYFDTVNVNSITISTATFPSANSGVNAAVATNQWCLDHIVVSAPATPSVFTIFSSSNVLLSGTTDFLVVTSTGAAYDAQWPYRDPKCYPVGQAVVTMKSSVAGSTITASGYLWKGWNQ